MMSTAHPRAWRSKAFRSGERSGESVEKQDNPIKWVRLSLITRAIQFGL